MPRVELPNDRRRPDLLLLDPPMSPSPRLPEKPNSRLLSFLLRAAILAVVTSCFFVFVGAAAILFLLLQLGVASTASRRRHHQSPNSGESAAGFSPDDLRKLPRVKYAAPKRDPSESGDDCAVCLSDLGDGDWCRFLPGCNHKFHANCIDKWLLKAPVCPICRRRVRLSGDSTAVAIGVEGSKRLRIGAGSRVAN